MKKSLCLILAFFIVIGLFGCAGENPEVKIQETSPAITETATKVTDATSAIIETATEIGKVTEVTKASETVRVTEVTKESIQIKEQYLFSVDVNYDGITEDFYVDDYYDSEYHVYMYSDSEKTRLWRDFTIDRTDKIDLYFYDQEEGIAQYALVQVVENRIDITYIGNNVDKEVDGTGAMGYLQFIDRAISCYCFNSSMTKEEFDFGINDTKNFLKQYDDIEYIETIDLGNLMNISENFIGEIIVCEGMKPIRVYSLKDDPWGCKLKFDNGTYSEYFFDSNEIGVYRRKRQIYTGGKYAEFPEKHIVETGEYEYLICLKYPENQTDNMLYLGIPQESYVFKGRNELKLEDEWEYVSTLDINSWDTK